MDDATLHVPEDGQQDVAEHTPEQPMPDDHEAESAPAGNADLKLAVREDEGDEAEFSPSIAQVVEAVLFATDSPLSLGKLADCVGDGATHDDVKQAIAELNEKYEENEMTFRVEAIARGYQLLTMSAFDPWLRRMAHKAGQSRLSKAALETLAIIAYRQPIIRADIEAIRGVAAGDGVHRLRELGLVKVVGRAEVVGRPILYGTTRKFLDVFGLADLKDLPKVEAFQVAAAAVAESSEPVSKSVEEVEPVRPPAPADESPSIQAAAGS